MGIAYLLDSTLVQCLLKNSKKTTSERMLRCYLLCSISQSSSTRERFDQWSSQVEGCRLTGQRNSRGMSDGNMVYE